MVNDASSMSHEKENYLRFNETQEQKNGGEFSKALSGVLTRANKLAIETHKKFFEHRLPSSVAKELVPQFNRAIGTYNSCRNKMIEIIERGFGKTSDRLFKIQEMLEEAAAVLQKIRATISKYPKIHIDVTKEREREENRPDSSTGSSHRHTINHLRAVSNVTVLAAAVLTACSPIAAQVIIAGEQNPSQAGIADSTKEGQEIDLASITQQAKPTEQATPTVTAEELSKLNNNIDAKLAEAAQNSSPITRMKFEISNRAEAAAQVFAKRLTNPENPKDRVLDPNSFSIGITPDGVAYLKLEVDSVWGKAGEVAIVDTGANNGMFVTLSGSGIDKGTLSLNESGYYAAAKNTNGEIVKVVDQSKQWVDPAKAERLEQTDVIEQIATAYVEGQMEIDFNSLSKEEYGELSVAITKELNNRIESPMYFSENGQTTYLDEATGKLVTISTAEFERRKKELAPKNYVPAKQAEDGTWMYLDKNTQQCVRIEGSAGFDFSSVVDENNMNSGIIQWPTTKKNGEYPTYDGPYSNLTSAQTLLKDPYNESYIPVLLQSNQIIEVPVQDVESGDLRREKALVVLVKKDYGFQKIYVVASASLIYVHEENSSKDETLGFGHETDGSKNKIKRLLIENQVYFLGCYEDQINKLSSYARININNIQGVVSPQNSFTTIINGQKKESKTAIIMTSILIRHTK